MVEKLTNLLIKAGVTWFPKKKAKYLVDQDVRIVTRCEHCHYHKKVNAPEGTVFYCNVFDKRVPRCGYCYNGK